MQVAGKAIAGEEEEPPLSTSARSRPASTSAATSPTASTPAQPKQSLSAPSRLSAPRRLRAPQSSPAAAPTASATSTPPPGVFCCPALSTSILTLGCISCQSTFPLCLLQTGCLKETSCSCTEMGISAAHSEFLRLLSLFRSALCREGEYGARSRRPGVWDSHKARSSASQRPRENKGALLWSNQYNAPAKSSVQIWAQ